MTTSTLVQPVVGHESEVETVPNESGTAHERPAHLTVHSSYIVPHHQERLWMETWRALEQIMLGKAECHDFRILRDRRDLTHYLVLSEWEDAASFHRFVRETSLLWLDRMVPGLCHSSELTILETVVGAPETGGGVAG